jgi:retinol dehydrogenase-12
MSDGARDLEGVFVVITGANTGIGRATAVALAARGAALVLACRSEERTQPVLAEIRARGAASAEFASLDLGSFASVRASAAQILAAGRPIDRLINNAGLAGHRGLTKDGFELAFGTNHLGHFLLTMLLLPSLLRARGARIVNVSSQAHYEAPGIDFDAVRRPTRTITGLAEYGVSKLANVLFTSELARRLGGGGDGGENTVHSYALHPGVVASDAWRRVPWPIRPLMKRRMLSNEDGAKTTLYCATSPRVEHDNGLYYDECAPKTPSGPARDAELAKRLWEQSAAWVGEDLA